MGRGRAKAKQTKVARQLKYNSGGTDLARLAEELGVSSNENDDAYDEESDDPYAGYDGYLDDEDDDEGEDEDHAGPPGRRR